MSKNKQKERSYTFHISQEELSSIEILAPLSIKQERYIQDQENDIIVWGGSAGAGKTQLSLLSILLDGLYDPDYVAGIVRNSQKQIKGPGSLWSSGCKLFANFGISSNKIELSWAFPSGAEVKCHHLDNNTEDYQGQQCTTYLVDEGQQCREDDVWYLTSRLRSKSSKKHQLKITCNPDKNSYLCRWLTEAGYLLESGLPNPAMDGLSTWMIQVQGRFEWHRDKADIEKLYGKSVAKEALRFVFYSANVYDNPYIVKHLPGYITKLENLKPVEKERLLYGNWYASAEGEGYIKREWFNSCSLSEIPLDKPKVRCWDLAATVPSPAYPDPDYTRGIKATYDKETGYFYIIDLKSCRDRPAVVQQLIERTASEDGKQVYIGIPKDGGAAGKESADNKTARLSKLGFKSIVLSARARKLERAEPFLIALQQGKVFVLPGVFQEEHWKELEAFDGVKNSGQHDDVVDALADCYITLTTKTFIPSIRMNSTNYGVNLGGPTLLVGLS